jgi:predicted transport protein
VVTQGLYYLDWIHDHKEAVTGLLETAVASKAGPDPSLYWPARRLICIAGDFNRFDRHAAAQMQRNIDLVEYCQFDIGFLMLSLKATTADPAVAVSSGETSDTATALLEAAPKGLFDLFQALMHFLKALGDDVQIQAHKTYFAVRRMQSFAWAVVQPRARKVQLYLPLSPANVELEAGFSRDVGRRPRPGSGGLELTLRGPEDLEKAKALLEISYRQH